MPSGTYNLKKIVDLDKKGKLVGTPASAADKNVPAGKADQTTEKTLQIQITNAMTKMSITVLLFCIFQLIGVRLDAQVRNSYGFFFTLSSNDVIFVPIKGNCSPTNIDQKYLKYLTNKDLLKGFKVPLISDSIKLELFGNSTLVRNNSFPEDFADDLKFIRVAFGEITYKVFLETNKQLSKNGEIEYKYYMKFDSYPLVLKYSYLKVKLLKIGSFRHVLP